MKRSLFLLVACVAALTANALAGDVTIGFIYVGPKDDYGYNQAHALGAASVAKLPGVKMVEEASASGRPCFLGVPRPLVRLSSP